jgi:hypothetical protein
VERRSDFGTVVGTTFTSKQSEDENGRGHADAGDVSREAIHGQSSIGGLSEVGPPGRTEARQRITGTFRQPVELSVNSRHEKHQTTSFFPLRLSRRQSSSDKIMECLLP